MELMGFFYFPLLGVTIINLVMAAMYGIRLVRGRGQRNGLVMVTSLLLSISALTLTCIAAWMLGRLGNLADWIFLWSPAWWSVVATVVVFRMRPRIRRRQDDLSD